MNLAERKKKFRQGRLWCNLGISGEILVVLVFFLLAVMMISTPEPPPNSAVDLARVTHPIYMPGANRENAILIVVFRDGTTFFGRDKVSTDQIAPRIREKVRTGSERKAYIKVDQRVKYGNVENVINAVSDGGISDIGFVLDQRKIMP